MGFGMDEVPYEPEERRRNQLVIGVLTVAATALILLVPTYTDWPFRNAIGIAIMGLFLWAGLYWMFASKSAGRLQVPTRWEQWRKHMNM